MRHTTPIQCLMKVNSTPTRQRLKAGLLVQKSFLWNWTGEEDAKVGSKQQGRLAEAGCITPSINFPVASKVSLKPFLSRLMNTDKCEAYKHSFQQEQQCPARAVLLRTEEQEALSQGQGNGCEKGTQARLGKERCKLGPCAGEWQRHTAYSLGANVYGEAVN